MIFAKQQQSLKDCQGSKSDRKLKQALHCILNSWLHTICNWGRC